MLVKKKNLFSISSIFEQHISERIFLIDAAVTPQHQHALQDEAGGPPACPGCRPGWSRHQNCHEDSWHRQGHFLPTEERAVRTTQEEKEAWTDSNHFHHHQREAYPQCSLPDLAKGHSSCGSGPEPFLHLHKASRGQSWPHFTSLNRPPYDLPWPKGAQAHPRQKVVGLVQEEEKQEQGHCLDG